MRRIPPPQLMPSAKPPATWTSCTSTPKRLANGFDDAAQLFSRALPYFNRLGFAIVDLALHGLDSLIDGFYKGKSTLRDIRIVTRDTDLELTYFVVCPTCTDLPEAHVRFYDTVVKFVERCNFFASVFNGSFRGLKIR